MLRVIEPAIGPMSAVAAEPLRPAESTRERDDGYSPTVNCSLPTTAPFALISTL